MSAHRRPFDTAPAGAAATLGEARRDTEWDRLVEAAPGGDLVQTTAWAESRQRLGHEVWHLRLHDPDGTLRGGCLLQLRRLVPGLRIGAIPRGPILFDEQPGLAERVLREVVAAARQLRVALLVVQPPAAAPTLGGAMEQVGFRLGGPNIAPSATIRMDLRRSEADLLRALHVKRRGIVRKLPIPALVTALGDDIEAFHRLYAESARRGGFQPVTLDNLRAQWDALAPRGLCRLFLTHHEGRVVAGEWFTCFAGTMTLKLRGYDISGSGPAARHAPVASLWSSLMLGRQEGIREADLGGFDRATAEALLAGQEPPAGFTASHGFFKWSFGGEVTLLATPRFILPGRTAGFALTAAAARLLAAPAMQRMAQRLRAAT